MKGHYMREAQPSGKLGHLAPYLKIDEYPPLPKALRVHLDSASPILTQSSHSQHTSRIRECGLSRRPQTNASIFYSRNGNQWQERERERKTNVQPSVRRPHLLHFHKHLITTSDPQ